jgi:hypothetical protein
MRENYYVHLIWNARLSPPTLLSSTAAVAGYNKCFEKEIMITEQSVHKKQQNRNYL